MTLSCPTTSSLQSSLFPSPSFCPFLGQARAATLFYTETLRGREGAPRRLPRASIPFPLPAEPGGRTSSPNLRTVMLGMGTVGALAISQVQGRTKTWEFPELLRRHCTIHPSSPDLPKYPRSFSPRILFTLSLRNRDMRA